MTEKFSKLLSIVVILKITGQFWKMAKHYSKMIEKIIKWLNTVTK
jgi:hypothetical protein